MIRVALLLALLPINLLLGSTAAPYGPAWWTAAVGFTTAAVALAASVRAQALDGEGGAE